MSVSVLCVTRGEPHVGRFLHHFAFLANSLDAEFVIAADRCDIAMTDARTVPVDCSRCPVIETVLEEAVAACRGDWILRLDDDETVSLALFRELLKVDRTSCEAVAFPRAHLWGDEQTMLTNEWFWPDVQMRFSKRHLAVRRTIHEGAPKVDIVLNGCLLHHAFLVKDRDGRREVAERYCRIMGQPMPEPPTYWPPDFLSLKLAPVLDGEAHQF